MARIDLEAFKEIYTIYSREIKALSVVIFFLVNDKVLNILLRKFFNKKLKNISEERIGKIRTLFNLFLGIKSVILWIIAFLIILSLYKVKLTAILTGFGLIGVILVLLPGLLLLILLLEFL
mgnify:CR=1 FL=1